MCLRAEVWRRLIVVETSLILVLQVVIAGFAVSFVMPLRVGEVARAYLLKRWAGVDYGIATASMRRRARTGRSGGGHYPGRGGALRAGASVRARLLCIAVAAIFAVLTAVLVLASWRSGSVVWATSALARRLPAKLGSHRRTPGQQLRTGTGAAAQSARVARPGRAHDGRAGSANSPSSISLC